MKRCVLLCRCSTEKEKGLQDYQYQIDTLTEICKKRDWEIVKETVKKKKAEAK